MNMMTQSQNKVKCSRLLDRAYNSTPNALKFNTHNTFAHELAKFLLAWEIKKNGHSFVSEAIFEGNKGRADLLNLNLAEALEIVHSEKEKSIIRKRIDYPVPVVPITARKVIETYFPEIKKCIGDE